MLALPGVAPDHLAHADQRQDCAIDSPVIVADHEANAESEVQALKDPDASHQNHHNSYQTANYPHDDVE
jgi:hypothetical protein